MVGAHFKLDTAVEIAVQRAVSTAAAWAGACNGVDFNLAGRRVIFQRAFRRRAEQREFAVLHEKHIRAGVALFQRVVGRERRRAGQAEAARRHHLENFARANRFLHFTHHRAVLFIALAACALHLRHGFNWQRRGRLLKLQLDLRETLVQAGFFTIIRRKQARLNAGGARLVIDDQQRFGEIKAVIRAAVGLRKRRQFFKTGDQVIGKQPAEEHRFALILRQRHQLLQQTKSVEYRQRTQTLIFIQQRTYRREAQRAPLWPGFNGDSFRQGVIQ